jgi:hypothetical protein
MTEAQWRQKVRDFTERLVGMKDEAGRLGLYRTMHAMDASTRETGYEQADIHLGRQVAPWKRTAPIRAR